MILLVSWCQLVCLLIDRGPGLPKSGEVIPRCGVISVMFVFLKQVNVHHQGFNDND